MKKIFFLLIGLFVASGLNAQVKKGWVSGSMSIQSVNPNDKEDTKFSIASFGPGFGYWVDENLTIGLSLSLHGKTTTDGVESFGGDINNDGSDDFLTYDSKEEREFVFAPFFRYYKGVSDKFKIYGQATLGVGSGTTTWDKVLLEGVEGSTTELKDVKYRTISMNVAPGVQYWFNDRWSINSEIGVLGYNKRTDKDAGFNEDGDVIDLNSSSFQLGLGLNNIRFSLNCHF